MRHPLAGPSRWRGLVFAILVATVVGLMGLVEGPRRCDGDRGSMVGFELAGSLDKATRHLATWSEASRLPAPEFLASLKDAILIDFAYLLAYSTALVIAVKSLGRSLGGRWWTISAPLAWAQWVAGALDAVENTALLVIIRGTQADAWARIAFVCAALKFALVVLGLLFVVVAAAVFFLRTVRTDPKTWPTPVLLATPLGKWLVSYPVLAGAAAIVIAVLFRKALAGLGIPDLFWHESHWPQFRAGIGVGFLIADLAFIGFLIDARFPWMLELAARAGWPAGERPVARALPAYLTVSAGPLLLIVIASATAANVVAWWPLLAGAIVGVALMCTLIVSIWIKYLSKRKPFLPRWLRRQSDRRRRRGVGDARLDGYAAILMAVRLALLALIMLRVPAGNDPWLPAAFSICLLVSTVTAFYGFFVTFFPSYRFGVLTLIVIAWIASNAIGTGSHPIREMTYGPRHERPGPSEVDHIGLAASGLADDRAVLETWKQTRGEQGPLIVLALDGGGVRAATWVMSVLTQLELELPGFAHQVRIITGASGGMLGASYWVASLQPPGTSLTGHQSSVPLPRTELVRRTAMDSLTPLVQRMVAHDLVPIASGIGRDRGDVIGDQWQSNTEGLLGHPFRSLQGGEREGWRPSLILSPMIVEDGRRLLISNLNLEALALRTAMTGPVSRDGVEFYRVFRDGDRLTIKTAVRMNATFPYVMPAIELPYRGTRRTVDAGYYEEHGVDLAATWLLEHQLALATTPVILIEVPAAADARAKAGPCDTDLSWWRRGLSGITTPPEAILAGRDSSGAYRNDEMIDEVDRTLPRFDAVAFEPPYDPGCNTCGRPDDEIALSWRLTGGEEQLLRDGMLSRNNCEARRILRQWWIADGGPPPSAPLLGCRNAPENVAP